MSTNAYIGIIIGENECRSIYLHWDGYVEYAGYILHNHYNSKEKVMQLLELGDMSSIQEKVPVFYGRNRDGESVDAIVRTLYKNVDKKNSVFNIEYTYIWNDEKEDYEVYNHGNYMGELTQVLEEITKEA